MENIKIHFKLVADEDNYPPVAVESVWARATNTPDEYIIDNIPFFTREAALEDRVRVRQLDGHHWFDHIVAPSGNSLFRIVFFDQSAISKIRENLISMGCSTEVFLKYNLMAICAAKTSNIPHLQNYFNDEAAAGTIDYEEAILRHTTVPTA